MGEFDLFLFLKFQQQAGSKIMQAQRVERLFQKSRGFPFGKGAEQFGVTAEQFDDKRRQLRTRKAQDRRRHSRSQPDGRFGPPADFLLLNHRAPEY